MIKKTIGHVKYVFISLTNTITCEWNEVWVISFRDRKIRNPAYSVTPRGIPP